MKRKIEVSLSIVLMVVILATILSLSFAWFSASNPQVFANNGLMTAADTESANANINITTDNIDYGGETGLDLVRGKSDYPYKAFYTFTVSFKPLTNAVCVTNDISSVDIKLSGETEPSIKSIDTPEITKYFSWDLYLVKPIDTTGGTLSDTSTIDKEYSFFPAWILNKEGEDWYYKEKEGEAQLATGKYSFTHYFPAECFGYDDDIIRDINGNPLELNHSGEIKAYTFVIEITFLDRASYCLHCVESEAEHPIECKNVGLTIKEFAYCHPDYMNSKFSLGLDIGFVKKPTVEEGTN